MKFNSAEKEHNTIKGVFKSATSKLPLIEGQVPVSKLCEQSPLQDLSRGLVLDEVDDDVLKSVVILR